MNIIKLSTFYVSMLKIVRFNYIIQHAHVLHFKCNEQGVLLSGIDLAYFLSSITIIVFYSEEYVSVLLRYGGVILCVVLAFFAQAEASKSSGGDVQEIDHEKRWSLYRAKQGNNFVCYIGSFPIKQEGDYKRRDDPYVIVINNDDGDDEVSISAGYPYLDKSNVVVSIDGKNNHTLFTRGEFAWTNDQEADNVLVGHMRRGLGMKVSATSRKHTHSYDTYSLLGFDRMYTKMKKLCVRGKA